MKKEDSHMKTWNTPEMNELDVRLTASSGIPANTEAGGYMSNGWVSATYDSNQYVREEAGCIMSIENKAALAS